MTKLYFTKDNVWLGGFYELALEVGINSDEQIRAVLQAIWSYSKLEGCYLDQSKETGEQQPITSSKTLIESGMHHYGLAHMPDGEHLIACGVCIIREAGGVDWVIFYLPLGALSEVYEVGWFPFANGRPSEHWQKPVDAWLAEMGKYIFSIAEYKLGLIGYEVSGLINSNEIAKMRIPEERNLGFLLPSGSEIKLYTRNKSSARFHPNFGQTTPPMDI